ncbi:hypothetical protein [Cellulosilyticum sp. I15G10I2]|uniref:hypothetical protein n=1 Tax=Cellulosilyticum sp. I15G10I2 TaxID=1892843 RepID=UPI00085BC949|nr:hypothetical protein [Cellulosilyticum sp. I15G10I2]
MAFKVIIVILLGLCIVSILMTSFKINKQYKKYHLQAIIRPEINISNTERYIGLLVEAFGAVIMASLLLSILINYYNEYLILALILSYLVVYYLNQYLPHTNWIIHAKGIISSRNRTFIEWQNIKSYRWLSRKNQDILIIEFKGKGIITQRADFIITGDQKIKVWKLLNERVVCTR